MRLVRACMCDGRAICFWTVHPFRVMGFCVFFIVPTQQDVSGRCADNGRQAAKPANKSMCGGSYANFLHYCFILNQLSKKNVFSF